MKNIYLYGCSDDLCQVNSDFGIEAEVPLGSSGIVKVKINDVVFWFGYLDAWVISRRGKLPPRWRVFKFEATSGEIIHLQIPSGDKVRVFEQGGDDQKSVFQEILPKKRKSKA